MFILYSSFLFSMEFIVMKSPVIRITVENWELQKKKKKINVIQFLFNLV